MVFVGIGEEGGESRVILSEETNTQEDVGNELGDYTARFVGGCQTQPELDSFAAQTVGASTVKTATKENQSESNMETAKNNPKGYCTIKLDSLILLKDSTKKLLYLIEDLQSKMKPSNATAPSAYQEKDMFLPFLYGLTTHLEDLPETSSLEALKKHIREIDDGVIVEAHSCSVYDRLRRKCNCLNRKEYNDLTIHFNDSVKYNTSDIGEMIKNMRILKKFVYMGGEYTKNALMFLNEGLTKSVNSEKVDIILAISHADVCNVFDESSMVRMCIKGPVKLEAFGDKMTQNLAARVIYRISSLEEGRRYLTFNSKILNDLKHVLKTLYGQLDTDTIEFLNSTVTALSPLTVPLINATYYCKADEGATKKILNSLNHFRQYMTKDEVFHNLDLLHKLSESEKGVIDMKQNFTSLCFAFKNLLLEYDNSEMNVIITSIMNKLLKRLILINENGVNEIDKTTNIATDTTTEPVQMKHENLQASPNVVDYRKVKSKYRQISTPLMTSLSFKNKRSTLTTASAISNLKSNTKKEHQGSVIVVPIGVKSKT